MKKKIKTGMIATLSIAFIFSTGMIFKISSSSNAFKKENEKKSGDTKDTASDISFVIDSYDNPVEESAEKAEEEPKNEEKQDSIEKDKNNDNTNNAADKNQNNDNNNKTNEEKVQEVKDILNNTNTNPESSQPIGRDEREVAAIKLVKDNDSNYISSIENKDLSNYSIEAHQLYEANGEGNQVINEAWGIDAGEEYVNMTTYRKNSEYPQSIATYLVSVKSGRVIAMPEDINMDAYEIKDNQVVKTYKYKDGTSKKWR